MVNIMSDMLFSLSLTPAEVSLTRNDKLKHIGHSTHSMNSRGPTTAAGHLDLQLSRLAYDACDY